MTAVWWRSGSGFDGGPVDLTVLSADQQLQAGLFCGNQRPNAFHASHHLRRSGDLWIDSAHDTAPGTASDDHNPPRIAPRHLFDLALGHEQPFPTATSTSGVRR